MLPRAGHFELARPLDLRRFLPVNWISDATFPAELGLEWRQEQPFVLRSLVSGSSVRGLMRSLGLVCVVLPLLTLSLGCNQRLSHFEVDPRLANVTRRVDRGSGWFTRVIPQPMWRASSLREMTGLGGVVEVDVAGREAQVVPSQFEISEEESVIGLMFNGRPRAYLLRSFEVHGPSMPEDLAGHVLMDATGSETLCVTYCDRTRVARVLRAGVRSETMPEVRVGGWDQGLMLIVAGARHRQDDQALPLEDVEFQIMKWGEWKRKHPQSELIQHATGSSR